MTRLGIELKPNDLSPFWDILRSHLPGFSAYSRTRRDLLVHVPRSAVPARPDYLASGAVEFRHLSDELGLERT